MSTSTAAVSPNEQLLDNNAPVHNRELARRISNICHSIVDTRSSVNKSDGFLSHLSRRQLARVRLLVLVNLVSPT